MSDKLLAFKDPKILIFLIPLVIVAGFLANIDKKAPLEFEADGKVVIAKWNTKNHNMHLFVIKQNDPAGTERKLESAGITLTPSQIKFGDQFRKTAGSKVCTINGVDMQCLK
jgi:hypothetical protein